MDVLAGFISQTETRMLGNDIFSCLHMFPYMTCIYIYISILNQLFVMPLIIDSCSMVSQTSDLY